MNRLAIILAAAAVLIAVPALAEKPISQPIGYPSSDISLGSVTPTPGMWFYEQQMRQYNDPRIAVREKAEFRAQQRQRRLASLKWYGFSNSRPQAGVDPQHSTYSPVWTSDSVAYPYRWRQTSRPWINVHPDGNVVSTY